jgi:hypothetical protein
VRAIRAGDDPYPISRLRRRAAQDCKRMPQGSIASTLSKRNRRPLSHSVLAQIYPATRRLTTFQFARAEEFETVTGEEYKNIKSHMPSEHFPRYI